MKKQRHTSRRRPFSIVFSLLASATMAGLAAANCRANGMNMTFSVIIALVFGGLTFVAIRRL